MALLGLLVPTTHYHGFTWLYLTLLLSTIPLLGPTHGSSLLYFSLLDSTTLYYGSTWLYMTLLHSTTALLGST